MTTNRSSEAPKLQIGRCSRCSSYTGADVGDIIRKKLGQTKVPDLGDVVFVKKYIASLDVSMHNR